MGNDGLKKALKTGEFESLYLFYGEEEYLKQTYLKQFENKVTTKETAEFNLFVFEGKSWDKEAFLQVVESYPVMQRHKLIIVKNYMPDAVKDEHWQSVEAVLKDLPEYSTVIFYYNGLPDFRKTKMKILLDLAKKAGTDCRFDPPDEANLSSWIRRHFEARQKQIDRDTVVHFLNMCSNDMFTLKNEIDKICAYTEGERITKSHVEAVVNPTVDTKAYELSNAMADRNYDKLLRVVDELFDMRVDISVIAATLYKTITSLYSIKLAEKEGQNIQQTAKTLGLRDFVAKNYAKACKFIPIEFLREAILISCETDARLKSSRVDKRVILESLIGKFLCMERKYG